MLGHLFAIALANVAPPVVVDMPAPSIPPDVDIPVYAPPERLSDGELRLGWSTRPARGRAPGTKARRRWKRRRAAGRGR